MLIVNTQIFLPKKVGSKRVAKAERREDVHTLLVSLPD